MKVIVFVKATKAYENGAMGSAQMMSEMGKYNDALQEAGILLDAAGLRPSSHGKRVRFDGKSRAVIDGPFAETKELIAGFWLWEVKSMEEAVEWLKRCPNPHDETTEVEIRPFFTEEDLAQIR